MANESAKAGPYEVVADRYEHRTSASGKPYEFKTYVKGDVVNLDVETAERLLRGGAVIEPGVKAQQDYEILQARADAAKAHADQAKAEAEHKKAEAAKAHQEAKALQTESKSESAKPGGSRG